MTVPPPIPPDFTIGKTNIIDARRMWHGGNKRCGAESNKTVCAYKDIPWSHLNGETLKKTRRGWGLWRRIMGYLEAELDKTPSPTHAWRSHPATHHRTIMMLVTVIPKGTSTGKRTTQPSMNSVATVDKKSPSCAEGGGSCCSCCRPDCWHGGNLKRIEIGTHTITHTQAVCFSRN